MCGPTSAISLEDHERAIWAELKESLRLPGHLAGLMRGFLGEEVAVVIATAPDGKVRPVALLVTTTIAAELLVPHDVAGPGWVSGRAGDYAVEVWVRGGDPSGRPVAMKITDWVEEHLLLYARQLWHRYRAQS
jgi:hypothetical protein